MKYWKSMKGSPRCKADLHTKALFINWKKRLFYALLYFLHRLWKTLSPKLLFEQSGSPLKKILIANQGSLGDVFLSTFVIPALKKAHPGCIVGLLVSKEGEAAGAGCLGVDQIHRLDHWLKAGSPFLHKAANFFRFHLREKRKLIKELDACGYDCAINLYPFFSDVIALFLSAKIPIRIAFDAYGYRELMTHPVPWECGSYLADQYQRLLQETGLAETDSFFSPWTVKFAATEGDYLIFHMGSNHEKKELSPIFWRGLLKELEKEGHRVYFTGQGEREDQMIEEVISHEVQNLCDRLSWEEWIDLIAGAKGVVSIDSAIIHIAAAFSKRFTLFYHKQSDPDLWRPPSEKGIAFIQKKELFPIQRDGEGLILLDRYDAKEMAPLLNEHFANDGVFV